MSEGCFIYITSVCYLSAFFVHKSGRKTQNIPVLPSSMRTFIGIKAFIKYITYFSGMFQNIWADTNLDRLVWFKDDQQSHWLAKIELITIPWPRDIIIILSTNLYILKYGTHIHTNTARTSVHYNVLLFCLSDPGIHDTHSGNMFINVGAIMFSYPIQTARTFIMLYLYYCL